MRALLVLGIAATLCVPTVGADETHADCEDDQPWLGYRATDDARRVIRPTLAGAGVVLDACEGEQWDGQDAIAGGETLAAGMGADPNDAPSADLLDPIAARLTVRGASEAYGAANVAFVGRAAVYVGTCGAGEPGLEGEASCGGTRELRTGVYVRDNSPSNVLTHLSPQCLLGLTGCSSSESDCTQATYQYGHYSGQRLCQRDNTALGVTLLLP